MGKKSKTNEKSLKIRALDIFQLYAYYGNVYDGEITYSCNSTVISSMSS